jgi:hypothetical protein
LGSFSQTSVIIEKPAHQTPENNRLILTAIVFSMPILLWAIIKIIQIKNCRPPPRYP